MNFLNYLEEKLSSFSFNKDSTDSVKILKIESEIKELNQSFSNQTHADDDKLSKPNGDQIILAERIDKHDSKFSTFKTKAENEFTSLNQKINNKKNTGEDPDHLVKTQFSIIEQKLADILHS